MGPAPGRLIFQRAFWSEHEQWFWDLRPSIWNIAHLNYENWLCYVIRCIILITCNMTLHCTMLCCVIWHAGLCFWNGKRWGAVWAKSGHLAQHCYHKVLARSGMGESERGKHNRWKQSLAWHWIIYTRNLLGWLEARPAQITLNYLNTAQTVFLLFQVI